MSKLTLNKSLCRIVLFLNTLPKAYSESRQIFKLFSRQPLTIFSKNSILDVWQDPEYAFACDFQLSFIDCVAK